MNPFLPIFTAILILFISSLTRSTFGFGDAIVAMPLLTLTIGIQTATPVVALISATIGLVIIIGDWRRIDIKAAWQLVLASAIGIPIGVLILRTAPPVWVKGFLGILLIVFSLYSLTRPALPLLQQRYWVYAFGFVSGILGAAYNTTGPPIVIYGTLRRWPPEHFRATLQGYFLPAAVFIVISHWLGGLWTLDVMQLYVLALPLVLIAIFLGGKLNQRISAGRFERLLYGVLIVLGLLLLI